MASNAEGTIPGILIEAAARYPDRGVGFPSTEVALPYPRLVEIAAQVAAGLRRRGVQPGDLIGCALPTSPEAVATLFGVLWSGAVLVPLPRGAGFGGYEATLRPIEAIVADLGIRHVIGSATARALFAPRLAGVRLSTFDEIADGPGLAEPACVPTDPAVAQPTSGSTARPKAALLRHANVVAGVGAIRRGAAITCADSLAAWVPLSHDMGLVSLLSAISAGCPVYLWSPDDFVRRPAKWLRAMASLRATMCPQPDFGYRYLIDAVPAAEVASYRLDAWRVAVNGSEPIDPVTVQRFAEHFAPAGFRPGAMFPVYGQAEATLAIAFPRLGDPPRVTWVDRDALGRAGRVVPAPSSDLRARGLVSVGTAVPSHCLRVVDEHGHELGAGRVGEIQFQGPAVMAGYHGNAAATAAAFDHGWLRTGDLGCLIDGQLHVTGRIKQMIILRGTHYYPEDAEALVRDLPGVYRRRVVALTVDDEMVVVAETRLVDGAARAGLADRIRARIQDGLGLAGASVRLVGSGTIRRTPNGKPKRLEMTGWLRDGAADAAPLGGCP